MRLKDATAGRREEFELEERAIAAVDDLTADLRGSIDTIWVKEHLKERRMYEATVGRMDRLQKSALIIWNKHAHLAIGEKEEYDDWLEMYKKERDMKIFERRAQLDREWKLWRTNFGVNARRIALGVKTPLKTLIEWSFNFDVTVPVDKNLNDLSFKFHDLLDHISAYVGGMRDSVEKYLDSEIRLTDSFAERSKQILLLDWQDNLHMLNNSINRRVGTLKDMESDLEETIRLTILQHEVENAVFEQLSCNRLEYFWIEWRNKMFSMCKQLKETQEDYQISKNLGKSRTRKSRKDRALDDLLALSRETAPPSKVNTLPPIDSPSNRVEKKAKLILGNGETSASEFTTDDDVDQAVSDTVRMKKLLDEIRPEVYRDFKHKMSRGLERIRRDLGEGKRRLVPPFAVCKTLLLNTDKFWDSARLSERCVGKLSSRGILLFKDGLPNNARALFCTASALSVMSSLTMVDNLIDCDDVFEILEHNQKQTFLIGLLSIALRIGSYGSYCIRQECLWACSTLGVEAPPELIRMSDAKGLDKNQATDNRSKGFYSDDSIDLANSVIALPTDPEAIRKLQETYNKIENLRDIPNVQNTVAVLTNNKQEDINTSNGLLEGPAILLNVEDITEINASTGDDDKEIDDIMADMAFGYKSNHVKVFNDLMLRVPLDKQIKKMSYLIPSIDITVLVSMLGRPDGSMELTPHRLCQVVSTWRRAALAIVTAAFDPPSSEYPRVGDLVTAHNANMTGRKRMGYGNISSVSPYEAVSSVIDWYTSIKGLPLSVVQGMCLMSRSGSCDPWLEDPKQSQRHQRLAYELNEMIDVYASDIPKSFNHNEFIQATVVDNILEVVKSLDLNGTGLSPLEMLRVYVQREDLQLTNNQITAIFWSVCRTCDDPDEIYEAMENSANDSYKSFQSGGVYKPIVATSFLGDPQDYMKRFSVDVDKYLESMPTIDINTVMGMLGTPLVPASAHELVADAMKLDASSRNAMPTSCCIWLGQRAMPLSDAIEAITVPSIRSKEGNKLIGVGCKDVVGRVSKNKFQSDLRTHVEIDLLTKYPEMCDIHASDKHYGPAGNEPINASGMSKDHWEELMSRRLARVDKLTLSWRDTMLNEWATSLYQSRHSRYVSRVDIIRQCVGVYHKQYRALRDGIINERGMLLSKFSGIEAELLSLIQEDYNFFTYHSSYLERALRRYEGQLERMILILKDILIQFQRHCGTIKRRAIARVVAASEKLKEDLEMSCNGLIMGYTAGYAQGYFDELLYRGEIWRKVLTDLQGQLIAEKEKFITAKDEVDRDVTIQVTDRLTLDRNKTKGYMDSLTEDTAKMLDILANTRASYASIQKDTNARLILRIEKAVRESRKLRVAAEQQAELEAAALRDIRYVLDTAKTSCLNIVHQVSSTSMQQLKAFEPLRKPHREKMETRIKSLEQSWNEVESVVMPLVDDYEREMHKQLRLMKAICMDLVGRYRDSEINALSVKYKKERTGLVTSFRKHFREYDLSEAAIFERFNREIVDTVKEMNALWGPSRPKFIVNNLLELERIPSEAMRESYADIQSTMHVDVKINDEVSLSRMEIADMFSTSLQTCYDTATVIPVQFVREKKDQLVFIDQMSMEKNGDMIRPQVKAVLDLLISGLEIDYDFGKGYESLISATHAKADESVDELTNFVGKYSDANVPISIGNSAEMTRARINRRKDEVNALLDASRAHVVADHSRLDVLVNAGEKDIEEWTSLTLQLVENAFHNAELSYLSNLWPTPPATPRIELVPEEEDRVGKLKALLNVTHNDSVNHPQNITNSMALVPADQADEDDFDDDELREARAEKERKRAEKENRRQEKAEREAAERALNDDQSLSLSTVTNLKPDETRELQNGWLECVSTEGYKYYFNSMTGKEIFCKNNI